MSNPYLVRVLPYAPEIFRRLLDNMPSDSLNKAAPGRFTVREVIAHMADWEPILLARLRQSVEKPGSTLEAYDEGEMAEQHGYRASDVDEQLRLFTSRRKDTVEFLSGISEGDWEKSAVHSERGQLTVFEQAFTMVGHDLYHVEQISAFLG